MDEIEVSQLEAARRQLATAIELWVNEADPVSIHTLAFCAYQIIHDLNRKQKGPPLLLDYPEILPEDRSEFINAIKNAPNFFKHADERKRRLPTSIKFYPKTNLPLLVFSLAGLKMLGKELTPREVAFQTLIFIKHPHLTTAKTFSALEQLTDAEAMRGLKARPNNEVFQALLKLVFTNT